MSKLNYLNSFIYKFRQEFFSPTRLLTKRFAYILNLLRFHLQKEDNLDLTENILIWDVRTNSITFDFVWVIFNAFFFFNCPEEGFQIIIFKPKEFVLKPFTFDSYDKYIDEKEMVERIGKLILVIAESFICIKNIRIESDKKKINKIVNSTKNILPKYYHPKYYSPEPLCYKKVHYLLQKENKLIKSLMDPRRLKKTLSYKNLIRDFGYYITFSLRDYGYSPERNIFQRDIDICIQFAKKLGCKILVIPDDIEKLKNYDLSKVDLVLNSARMFLEYRFYLYSNSLVNILSTSGPASASINLIRSRTIILNYASGAADNPAFYKKFYGLNIGDQPYLKLGGYLMWSQIYKNYNLKDLLSIYKKIKEI